MKAIKFLLISIAALLAAMIVIPLTILAGLFGKQIGRVGAHTATQRMCRNAQLTARRSASFQACRPQ